MLLAKRWTKHVFFILFSVAFFLLFLAWIMFFCTFEIEVKMWWKELVLPYMYFYKYCFLFHIAALTLQVFSLFRSIRSITYVSMCELDH